MNPEDQEVFDRIVNTSPSSLTPEDISFLNARRDYLTTAQKEDYKSILRPEGKPEVEEEEIYVSAKERARLAAEEK